VVAEGVERTSQLRVLQDLGCHYAQGFGICRPVEADAIGSVLRRDLFLA
jgi:EAL domain-containing protein (putative c-di-GMP-specific phosphodiesterase class I)